VGSRDVPDDENEKETVMSDFNTRIIEEFRANGGKVSVDFDGCPLILLHQFGAKSGAERVTPVACFPQSDGRLVVWASNGGAEKHPDWYHNLKAHPEIYVEFGAVGFDAAVRELGGGERARVWADAVSAAPTLGEAQKKTSRTFPVLLLTRITDKSPR
jgi:deazaflavin-dependent oxidoreductase (nitroreductase family)